MILASGSTVHGTVPCEMSPVAENLQIRVQAGNSSKNFNHGLHTEETASYIDDVTTLSHLVKKRQEVDGMVNAQGKKLGLDNQIVTLIKRREGSTDEDSSSIAEHLKAKKNIDMPGMSKAKSFLSFPNAKIKFSFRSLGIFVRIDVDVDKGIDNIKDLEYQRLLEALKVELENLVQNTTYGEDMNDLDSDFEMDYHAIKHLTGDIAEDPLSMDGSCLDLKN
jgi:hypothetical protein